MKNKSYTHFKKGDIYRKSQEINNLRVHGVQCSSRRSLWIITEAVVYGIRAHGVCGVGLQIR